jgi:hypothetical protein
LGCMAIDEMFDVTKNSDLAEMLSGAGIEPGRVNLRPFKNYDGDECGVRCEIDEHTTVYGLYAGMGTGSMHHPGVLEERVEVMGSPFEGATPETVSVASKVQITEGPTSQLKEDYRFDAGHEKGDIINAITSFDNPKTDIFGLHNLNKEYPVILVSRKTSVPAE